MFRQLRGTNRITLRRRKIDGFLGREVPRFWSRHLLLVICVVRVYVYVCMCVVFIVEKEVEEVGLQRGSKREAPAKKRPPGEERTVIRGNCSL